MKAFYLIRFTEELFATLIAFIFIFNAFKNLSAIHSDHLQFETSNCNTCNCTADDQKLITLVNNTMAECQETGGSWVSNWS